jgi:hypothetical protein
VRQRSVRLIARSVLPHTVAERTADKGAVLRGLSFYEIRNRSQIAQNCAILSTGWGQEPLRQTQWRAVGDSKRRYHLCANRPTLRPFSAHHRTAFLKLQFSLDFRYSETVFLHTRRIDFEKLCSLNKDLVAEREGFEPSIRFCRILTFQASAFDHSATAPHIAGWGRLPGLRGLCKPLLVHPSACTMVKCCRCSSLLCRS